MERMGENAFFEALKAANEKPETVHGYWQKNIRGNHCKVCSKCGFGFDMSAPFWSGCNRLSDERESVNVRDWDYCPNCGAKMDKKGCV